MAGWSLDELEALRSMDASSMTNASMGEILGRSEFSIKAKLATVRDKSYRQTKRGPNKGASVLPTYQVPVPRKNDCKKHLTLILNAHRAGFPVCGRAAT